MSAEAVARLSLACANVAVAALNARAYWETRDARDLWSAIAWAGSTTFWLWSATL